MSARKNPAKSTAPASRGKAADKVQQQAKSIVPFTLPDPTEFEQDLANALQTASMTLDALTAEVEKTEGIEEYRQSNEVKRDLASTSIRKQKGTFSVSAILTQVNPYPKHNYFLDKDVTSYMITARITTASISTRERARLGITLEQDAYGSYFLIPTPCNLSPEKYLEYQSEKSQGLTEKKAAAEFEASARVNVSKPANASSTSRPLQLATAKLQLKRTLTDAFQGQSEAAAQKKLKATSTNPTTTTTSSTTTPISRPHVEEPDTQPSDSTPANSIVSYSTNGHLEPLRVEANGVPVFDSDAMHGKRYHGSEVIMLMRLPIDKDVTFSVEENFIKAPPSAWTLVQMDIKGNPYITKEGCYSTTGWTITNIGETKTLPKSGIYKFFEVMCQSTPVNVYIHPYTESQKTGVKVIKSDKKRTSTPLENSTLMWFVVGNEISASRPLADANEDAWKVYYQLVRVRSPESFKKNDPNNKDKMIGLLPYKFDCTQWKGKYTYDNPTLMKFQMELTLGWKHVCPSTFTSDNYKPSANKSLRINSIMAWQCLMNANYPHIKMALNVKESLEGTANILFNSNRYGEGLTIGDVNYINKPHSTAVKRQTTPTFKKMLFIQKAIVLTLETIKSCCIPVTQDYIVNTVWGGKRQPPQSSEGIAQLDGVALLPIDFNDLVHCLSESSGTEQLFMDPIEGPNPRYNFYAMANFCFREDKDREGKDKPGTSIIKMLQYLPKTPQEGVIYLEAIRNIISSGGHTDGCFATERSILDLGDGSTHEKYKRFLEKYMVPEKSVLHKIDPADITIFHPDTKLLVYFYAIPVHLDDPENNRGQVLANLRGDLGSEIASFLHKKDAEGEEGEVESESDEGGVGDSQNTQKAITGGTSNDAPSGSDIGSQMDIQQSEGEGYLIISDEVPLSKKKHQGTTEESESDEVAAEDGTTARSSVDEE